MLSLEALDCGIGGPVTVSVRAGECLGVSGPSGSGKTRLLRAVADLDPHTGEASLDGERCNDLPAHLWRRRVALLPAESRWWADTVDEHFAAEVPELLDALGLDAALFRAPVARLSSGERQRLALARVLALTPGALLLDEPTANLDETTRERVERVIDARRRAGVAIMWISHDPAQLSRVARRRLVIRDGRWQLEQPGR